MRLAYADPPYPGRAYLYPENTEVDHAELIAQLERSDFRLGRIAVTWIDLWTRRHGLEVTWDHRVLVHFGF